ncbi:hypothetical protein BDN70DRAFT_876398 [Pholiota conissans]|uniref:Uncharacterized protein n=1 Tax=Pholiota conissans TaxID=109636 RepID=A0A9P6D2H0_9AGAR|nr:hypothetical protein BDN70DRAFT_876398 [Pholiota conissans]
MSASQFASFAAYKPPPDEADGLTSSRTGIRTSYTEGTYQSGDIPTFSSPKLVSSQVEEDTYSNPWATRYGWRVDVLAFCAYIFGPLSALVLLILETHNDCVRFHAYQSALLTTPLVFFRIMLSLARFSSWTKLLSTLVIFTIQLLAGFLAYRQAAQHQLIYLHIPFIGPIAENWLADE